MLSNILRKIKFGISGINNAILTSRNYKEIKKISRLSVLSLENIKNYSAFCCSICRSKDIHLFIKLPLGAPGNQNHSLLYFNYEKIDTDALLKKKNILDSTLGFFLLIPWNFCNRCKNASIGISFSNEHLLDYYSKFYFRKGGSEPNRRNTKELHGKYLSALLNAKSKILEIGAAEGFTAEYLAHQGHEVFVFEPSKFRNTLKQIPNLKYLNDIGGGEDIFDAIYLHHVLEHIFNPVSYLKKISVLLKKEGLLLIQVPDLSLQLVVLKKLMRKDIYSLFNRLNFYFNDIKYKFSEEKEYQWFDALANDHISAFTPEGITYILEKSGLYVIEIIRSTTERIVYNPVKYAWPVDGITGNTPNGITVIARRSDS